MNPREAVELEVLGAEGEPRAPPRPLRLSLLELLGKLVRRDQPAAVSRRSRHNHRFRTFVACGQSLTTTAPTVVAPSGLKPYRVVTPSNLPTLIAYRCTVDASMSGESDADVLL